ncbi:MAG: glutamate-1-semialdehyde 2,1-aminomutase [Thermodesulfobacteriota bacterium]|nr:glutamate-1-semialdehyde 2,1-aminomutase [Thermodesulfobacteriota bacterium]
MNFNNSKSYYTEAMHYIPGGVNSPVRAFKGVGGSPIFIEKAKGSKLYDVDGNEYIDYIASWGPMILGHAHPEVVAAIQNAAENGSSYGAPTHQEIEIAQLLCEAFPSIELVRMVSSGTEATMSALRVARGFTKKDKIVKFEGCYHGHSDSLLVKAGSGGATFGIPDSLGISSDLAKSTITLPYNDLEAFSSVAQERQKEIACVILEPIPANMGVIIPKEGFLEGLRKICDETGILLIFDEVITGFRVAYGGAQTIYHIKPDLTCLGKIIGGGLPVGAFGGRKDVMELVSPLGGVYQAGTLSGNPIAVAAGLTTLRLLSQPGLYENIEEKTQHLVKEVRLLARKKEVDLYTSQVGSLFCNFFTNCSVIDFTTAKTSNIEKYAAFFWNMIENGVYMAPSQFEAGFLSASHTDEDIHKTIHALERVFSKI